jgi:hypothetical protein
MLGGSVDAQTGRHTWAFARDNDWACRLLSNLPRRSCAWVVPTWSRRDAWKAQRFPSRTWTSLRYDLAS